jgi:asparagine N-glycosylation enzyme membrane subunit Stt3
MKDTMPPETGLTRGIGLLFRPTPGTRLILIAVPVVILLGAIGLVLAWRNYHAQRDLVIDESRLLAVSAAADADRFLRGEIALLDAVATSPTMRGTNQAAIEVYLQELSTAQPTALSISWIDLDGAIRATAPAPEAEVPTSVADHDYFQHVTQREAAYVSAASPGRQGNEVAIVIAVPTRGPG